MPKAVFENDVVAPGPTTISTTLFTKVDGLYVVLADGTVIGPLGVGTGGVAGGALTGTYPNPGIANGAVNINQLANGSVTGLKIAASAISLVHINPSLIDPIAAQAGLRTLGTGAQQAAAGNDPRLSDARTPTGSASGDMSGSYPSPTIAKLQGYTLDLSTPPSVNDVLMWDGTKWVASPSGGSGITQLTQDVLAGPGSGSQAATVVAIQTYPVSATAPAPGEALVWNGVAYVPTAVAGGSNNLVLSLSGAWLQTGLSVGDAVRGDSVADTAVAADNTSSANALPFLGMVYATPTVGTATVAYFGEFPWSGAPLTPGATYFLDSVSGGISTTPPSSSGAIVQRIGFAKSTTILFLAPGEPILL